MRGQDPVSVSCEVLQVSASDDFDWPRRCERGQGGSSRLSDEALLAHIRASHADEGWVYLAVDLDLFSPQVVGWSLQRV